MEPAKSFCSYAAMPSPRRASRASCGWETAHCSTAARRAALGVSRSARTSGARPEGGGADIAVNASRLSQRAGIVFAKQFRFVMSQRSHQFQMQVVHHAGTWLEKQFPDRKSTRLNS